MKHYIKSMRDYVEENRKLKKQIDDLKNIKAYEAIDVDCSAEIISNNYEDIMDLNLSCEEKQVNDQSAPEGIWFKEI